MFYTTFSNMTTQLFLKVWNGRVRTETKHSLYCNREANGAVIITTTNYLNYSFFGLRVNFQARCAITYDGMPRCHVLLMPSLPTLHDVCEICPSIS